jgi:hypothetical protein
LIQFHFKGSAKFIFNQGNYALVKEEKSLLLYNPQKLPLNLELAISWVISVIVSIKKFHALFSTEANYITFFGEDNKDKKYTTKEI